jgi:transposase
MDYCIKEREWEYIFEFLRRRADVRSKNEAKLRIFIEAMYYIIRTGCQWRMLPLYYGSWRSVHQRFKRWTDKGIFQDLFESNHSNADMESVMIDATIIRAHACSAGYEKNSGEREALGRSKGGFTSKIHAVVDSLGNPLKFIITPGQRNDITQGAELVKEFKNTTVIADKGYDSDALVNLINDNNSNAVIPPKKNRKVQRGYDKHVYKERHLIECFFGKIKHFRRIFSRFDKTVKSFMGFLNFVGTLIWLR